MYESAGPGPKAASRFVHETRLLLLGELFLVLTPLGNCLPLVVVVLEPFVLLGDVVQLFVDATAVRNGNILRASIVQHVGTTLRLHGQVLQVLG